ncbi:serine/threonine-protein kinase [Streptomyces sp. NPDC059708]|uniref:serine/threonine-protein kinase n=1 Tax=Streptomyces sp. NPDC059708 TaxID=3346916 RepID=UPI00369FD027
MIEPLGKEDPRQVGPYELVRRLGRGGMGEVFLGRSPGGRLVAVKVVAAELAHDADFRRRFALEVTAARKVGGFYTAQVVDADTDAVRPWLVTAYIPGPSLHQVVRDTGPLPQRALRVLGSGLAEGLAAIHAAGLVHRDLKPGNVIVADDGPRVIDFGIARALDGGQHTGTMVIGTPGFMSPEQARGEPTGPASDVFALGCVLTFAATGHSPYGQGRPDVILYRTVHQPPDLDGVPDELTAFLRLCLAPEPGRRPLLSDALRHLATSAEDTRWLPPGVEAMIGERRAATVALRDRTAPEPPGTGPEPGPEPGPVRRRRRAVAAAAALAVGGAAWAAVAFLHPFGTGGGAAGTGGTGGTGASGAGATAKATAWSGDPCDVTNYTLIQDHQLTSVGQAGGFTSGSERVKTCTWKVGAATVDNASTMTLAYSTAPFHVITDRKVPKDPAELELDKLTSAEAYVDQAEDRCEVDWRTPGGYAAVLYFAPSIGSPSCWRAARFAQDLAPGLAGGTRTP